MKHSGRWGAYPARQSDKVPVDRSAVTNVQNRKLFSGKHFMPTCRLCECRALLSKSYCYNLLYAVLSKIWGWFFFFFFLVPIVFKALSFCDDLLNYGSHFSRGSYMSNGHQRILLGTERSKTDGKVSYRSPERQHSSILQGQCFLRHARKCFLEWKILVSHRCRVMRIERSRHTRKPHTLCPEKFWNPHISACFVLCK